MSTITREFTKEQLIEAAKIRMESNRYILSRVSSYFSHNLLLNIKLDEIAMASLEAEPVGYEIVIPESATHSNINEICPPGVNQTLFASGWNACRKSGMNSGRIPPIVKGIDAECVGWNACRSAMPQGADGNSPVIPDGLPTVCAEAYQVVGVMAEALGVFDDAAIQKVMDNLAQQKLVHCDVLPFSLPAPPQLEVNNDQ